MTDPRSDKPLQTPPVLPPTYRKPNKFTLILPWILLLLVLLAGLWMMTKPQLPWQKNQAMVASQPSWQPPKSEPVDTKKLGDNPNAAVASYHNAVAAAAQSVVNIYTTQKIEEHPYMNDPMMRRYFEYHGIPMARAIIPI